MSVFGIPPGSEWPIATGAIVFAAATATIALAGTRTTKLADRIADKTGLGEAVIGATLLGASTSLAGVVTSVAAGADGYPELAVSNAIGGIAAQTVFLGIADLAYRHANLEHAVTSIPNLLQGALLIALLALVLLAATGPRIEILSVHPVTVLPLVGYGLAGC